MLLGDLQLQIVPKMFAIPIPNCLKRCGLAPVNPCLTQSEVCLVRQYLLCVAAKAIRALALEYPDRVELAEPSACLYP